MPTAPPVELCTWCTSRHNRTRSSLCRCNHCCLPLCFECMKDHNDELLGNVNQLSDRYNEVHELAETKQQMIENEATKAIAEIHQWFNKLIETKEKIVGTVDKAKKDAQARVSEILSMLQMMSLDIQGLAKEAIFEQMRTTNILTELNRLEQDLKKLLVTRKIDLPQVTLTYELNFEHIVPPTTSALDPELPQASVLSQSWSRTTWDTNEQTSGIQTDSSACIDDNSSSSGDSLPEGLVSTSYSVDCLASDGINVLYTSIDCNPLLIAYCHLDNRVGEDPYRAWYQARIVDMIYWKNINKFVCATNKGVYTIDYDDGRFKIQSVIRGSIWFDVRVAANSNELWLWINPSRRGSDVIQIYSTEFQHIRTINFGGSISDLFRRGTSFAMTKNHVASICKRAQNNVQVVQINICSLDMKLLKSKDLGTCTDLIQIRTDGNNRFFVTTGQRKVHIVLVQGEKKAFDLRYPGNSIAVVNDKNCVVGDSTQDLELMRL